MPATIVETANGLAYSAVMQTSSGSEELLISPTCFETKAWFQEHPGSDIIAEILDWVKETGRPHDWRGHTHTKPPKGSSPKYLDEFDVPTFGHIVDRVAPCPCCSPLHAKYKRGGKIAWFEAEGVIRLIGPRCFYRLSPEGHHLAERELRARKAREKAIRYLAGSLPRLNGLLEAAQKARIVGLAVERFRDDLLFAVESTGIGLWDHCSTGDLYVYRRDNEASINKDGEVVYREVEYKVPYAPLRGYKMISPQQRSFTLPLDNIVQAIKLTVSRLAEGSVDTWHDIDLSQALKAHHRTLRHLSSVVTDLKELQEFVGPVSLATLRTWGQRPDSTLRVFVARERGVFKIGRSAVDWVKSDIPPDLENELVDPESIDPGPDRML